MADRNRIVINQQDNFGVRSSQQKDIRVRPSVSVVRKLDEFQNVDTENLKNGSVLVYKTTTESWTATTNLVQQNIDGGEF